MTIFEEYINHPGVSRSFLISLSTNPSKQFKLSSTYLDKGSALDLLVSEGPLSFDSVYSLEPNPPSKGDYYRIAKAKAKGENYEQVYNETRLKSSLEDVERLLRTHSDWEEYINKYKELYESGKVLISPEEKSEVFDAYARLLKDEQIRTLVNNVNGQYQVPVYGTINDILCKGLIDIMIIDKEKKEIELYDLKTTSDYPLDFIKSYFKYRYDIQGSFYHELVKLNYPNYTIKFFRFIVVSFDKRGVPYMFEMTPNELFGARNGRIKFERYYKGYRELLEDYKLHQSTGNWDYIADYIRDKVIYI